MRTIIRPAQTGDVRAIRALVDSFAGDGPRMLKKSMVTLYEDVQEFVVAVDETSGGEVRTVAVAPGTQRNGIGSAVLLSLLARARTLGIKRVFCLTFAIEFFGRHGFVEIDGVPVDHSVYEQLLDSYDEGVAEMLGLERAKPNTLGNHRMLLVL